MNSNIDMEYPECENFYSITVILHKIEGLDVFKNDKIKF